MSFPNTQAPDLNEHEKHALDYISELERETNLMEEHLKELVAVVSRYKDDYSLEVRSRLVYNVSCAEQLCDKIPDLVMMHQKTELVKSFLKSIDTGNVLPFITSIDDSLTEFWICSWSRFL